MIRCGVLSLRRVEDTGLPFSQNKAFRGPNWESYSWNWTNSTRNYKDTNRYNGDQ